MQNFGPRCDVFENATIEGRSYRISLFFGVAERARAIAYLATELDGLPPGQTARFAILDQVGQLGFVSGEPMTGAVREHAIARIQALEPIVAQMEAGR